MASRPRPCYGTIAAIGTAAVMPTIVFEVRETLEQSPTAKKRTFVVAVAAQKVGSTEENSAAQLVKITLAIGAMAAIVKDWNK
ncbi:hypothetical protein QUB63_22545 [Microcoleus sp. ARI1-B5]|uniref:hypothetical protein n=1 Tax=unclassified Microcoleus TaxID=2642155 RepID=UPI002FD47F08